MDHAFTISSIPSKLSWVNKFSSSFNDGEHRISITSGVETDWFIDPAGGQVKTNAPIALFVPPDQACCIQAKVTVGFTTTYDAGVLFVYSNDALWAKLCFEYSPQQQPMIVSVVTRVTSDDCNSVVVEGNSVYLRVYRHGEVFAFHYSLDGRYWHFVRYFTLGKLEQLRMGFSAQSPMGAGCQADFIDIRYMPGILADLRSGE